MMPLNSYCRIRQTRTGGDYLGGWAMYSGGCHITNHTIYERERSAVKTDLAKRHGRTIGI